MKDKKTVKAIDTIYNGLFVDDYNKKMQKSMDNNYSIVTKELIRMKNKAGRIIDVRADKKELSIDEKLFLEHQRGVYLTCNRLLILLGMCNDEEE